MASLSYNPPVWQSWDIFSCNLWFPVLPQVCLSCSAALASWHGRAAGGVPPTWAARPPPGRSSATRRPQMTLSRRRSKDHRRFSVLASSSSTTDPFNPLSRPLPASESGNQQSRGRGLNMTPVCLKSQQQVISWTIFLKHLLLNVFHSTLLDFKFKVI